jgi:hypothetical protein
MSPEESTQSAVNNAQIGMLIKGTDELNVTVTNNEKKADKRHEETYGVLNELLQSQVRSEEQRISNRDWQRRTDEQVDKQADLIAEAQTTANAAIIAANESKSQSLSNARWINLGVGLLTGIALYISKEIIDAMDWFTKV